MRFYVKKYEIVFNQRDPGRVCLRALLKFLSLKTKTRTAVNVKAKLTKRKNCSITMPGKIKK
jgi:hypothetical protein